ncbi:MAG: response regulator [Erythrobacter sp.]
MTRDFCILLVEDEPLILMDLEYAAQQRGCDTLIASKPAIASKLIEFCKDRIDAAVLDIDLGKGGNCFEVIAELKRHGIPFVLHSGSTAGNEHAIAEVGAPIFAKPAPIASVIDAALACRLSEHEARDMQAAG